MRQPRCRGETNDGLPQRRRTDFHHSRCRQGGQRAANKRRSLCRGWSGRGRGGTFCKKSPLSPAPPLPFKNSYQGESQGAAATAGLPLTDGSPGGSCDERQFFLRWGGLMRDKRVCPAQTGERTCRESFPLFLCLFNHAAGGPAVWGRLPEAFSLPSSLTKFFAGWMGGAGGRKGAFLQKSPLPSPRKNRAGANRLRPGRRRGHPASGRCGRAGLSGRRPA